MKHAFRLLCLTFCLLLLASCDWRGDRYERLLEQAEWMNRHDSLFTSDSLGLALVRHYDHWWHSRNHRLRAYYMLGCAYRDMGEAPAALHYYHIATEQADTAAADCDFATLFRVYGQMALIYGQQNMPQEQLESLNKYCQYAKVAKDTLSYILGYEHRILPYYLMNDTTAVLKMTENASMLFMKHGYDKLAAGVYPTAIYVSLSNGNFQRAHHYMHIFERQSGAFDERGNIEAGRELYYDSKGLYYIGIGQPDSAEYWFRRLLQYGHTLEANRGLLSVFKQKEDTDSIIKYVTLTEQSLKMWAGGQQANAIIQSSAMYRYERNQSIATQKTEEARMAWLLFLFLFTLFILFINIAIVFYHKLIERRIQKERALCELGKKYNHNRRKYQHLQGELSFLRRNYAALQESSSEEIVSIKVETSKKLEEKQSEIDLLTGIINESRKEIRKREENLLSSEIVTLFREMAEGMLNGRMPSKKDWEKLVRQYKRSMPHMFALMQEANLSPLEMKTAILTHINFTVKNISSLFDTSLQNVSKAKSHANYKLFHQEKGASDLYQNLKKCAQL